LRNNFIFEYPISNMKFRISNLRQILIPFILVIFLTGSCQSQKSTKPKGIDVETLVHLLTESVEEKDAVFAKEMMVSTANPYATKAGFDILKKGGNVVDAAVAIQMVLTLVEPQSSGIGGGLFLLYYDHQTKKLIAVNGRETAPKDIDPHLFMDKSGKGKKFFDVVFGGMSVGTPGVLKALKLMHDKHGKLAWKELFVPAITLSRDGYKITKRQNFLLQFAVKWLPKSPGARKYFYQKDGTPYSAGSILKNPELAKTLEIIANNGIKPFYDGPIAKDIVAAVKNAYQNPGYLSLEDLKAYRAQIKEPICLLYREYKVCGVPPPTSGGIAVLQILGILENFDLGKLKPLSPRAIHLFAEASKLAFADRGRYVADDEFIPVPIQSLLDKGYLKTRAKLIKEKNMGKAKPGTLPKKDSSQWADDISPEYPSTTHFTIVDRDGNAITVTSTIEHAFGSSLMVDGFFLNNQLTDFSFVSERNGKKIANRVQPGKRPRSSTSPMMVFDKAGNVVMLIGSAGDVYIIDHVAQALVGVLDWGLNIQEAISMPHYAHRNRGKIYLETGTDLDKLQKPLEALGHNVKYFHLNSGAHGIAVTPNGLVGGADTRRDGAVMGK